MNTVPYKGKVLVIDDDEAMRYSLKRVLSSHGFDVETADSGRRGLNLAETEEFEVIFLDNRMDEMDGLETLKHLKAVRPHAMVIFMTAYGTTQSAIEAMKHGAYDYIVKPFASERVCAMAESATADHRAIERFDGADIPNQANEGDDAEGIVGESEAMQNVFKTIGQVAPADVTVLITGESGTGKELVAKAIHRHSRRNARPFLALNCAAIPENLIESELFGHERGAFTGAAEQQTGKFESCDGGTIFLDEIGDMSQATQMKVLRVLQEGEIQRVGGTATIKVDVRVIAATNRNLESLVESNLFRKDLYYRLNVVPIRIPPLRLRTNDIPRIVDFLLQKLAKERGMGLKRISPDALRLLMQYGWPGNVRELENLIQWSAVLAQGDTILARDLPAEFSSAVSTAGVGPVAEETEDGRAERESKDQGGHPNLIGNPLPASASLPSPSVEGASGGTGPPPSEQANLTRPDLCFDLVYRHVRASCDIGILTAIEREMIQRALMETGGNQVKASSLLGMARVTLRKRINEYGIRY